MPKVRLCCSQVHVNIATEAEDSRAVAARDRFVFGFVPMLIFDSFRQPDRVRIRLDARKRKTEQQTYSNRDFSYLTL